MGYGDYNLRGLEYYVVDGSISAVGKLTISKKIFQTMIPIPIKNKLITSIPLSVFTKAYTDVGYAYNKNDFNTQLNNKVLYTGGFGFDIISLYDMKVSIEFSVNQMNEKGIFLHSSGVM